MSYNLSEIKFTVETGALTEAINKLGQLKAASQAIRDTAAARKESIQVQREEVKLENDQEKLKQNRLNTLKKQREETKAATNSTEDNTEALEDNTEKMNAATKMVERQTLSMKIMRNETFKVAEGFINMGEGLTNSQAKQLASLNLLGATSEQMITLANSFQEYNRITGLNTFDKSASGLTKMRKELKELNDIDSLTQEGLSLTRDEIVNFVRDTERLTQQFKSEGRSAAELKEALLELRTGYASTSVELNKRRAVSEEMERVAKKTAREEIKAANDVAKANEYIERELAKVENAALEVNAAFSKSTSDGIFKFEAALKRSGMTADAQADKLKKFREAQKTITTADDNKKTDYITRAVGPQITDIFVGLSTGQSPLTVMLQQGGQLRDMFSQMKVDSKDMSDVMRNSMRTMVVSIKDTAFAVTSLLGGAIKDTSVGIGNFLTKNIQQMTIAMRATQIELLHGAEAAKQFKEAIEMSPGKMTAGFRALQLAMTLVGATLVVGAVALGTYLVALYKTNKAENELSRSLLLTGASLGMNISQASALISEQGKLGVSMTDTTRVLTAMAKEGGFTQEQFLLINKAAIELERVGGPKIEETVKRFAKFKDEPVKALRELQMQTGMVNEEVIKSVRAFEKKGETVAAATLADKEAARVLGEVSKDYEKQAGIWTRIGLAISRAFEPISNVLAEMTRATGATEELAKAQKNLAYFKGSKFSSDRDIANAEEQVRIALSKVRIEKEDAYWKEYNTERGRNQVEIEKDLKDATKNKNEELARTLSLTDYIAKRRESIGVDKKKFVTPEQFKQYDELFKKEWETHNKSKELKENTLSVLEKSYEDEKRRVTSQLQSQLEIKKFYQQLEIGDMEDNVKSQNELITKSFNERYKRLEDFGKKWNDEIDRQIANAKGGAKTNLQNTKKGMESKLGAEKQQIDTDYIKTYEGEIRNALKAWKDVAKQLDEINLKEKDLIAQRKRETDLKISAITNDPEQQAVAAAKVDEQNRQAGIAHQLQVGRLEADRRIAEISYKKGLAIREGKPTEALDALMNNLQSEKAAVEANIAAWNAKSASMVDAAGEQGKLNYMVETFAKFTADITNANFGQVLGEQFGKAAGGIGSMIDALNDAKKAQKAFDAVQEETTDPDQRKKNEDKYFHGQINNYAKMAGAAKNFFSKKTAAAKAASVVETGLQTLSIAMSLKETAVKIGGYIEEMAMAGASEATKTAVAEAGWFARMGIYASEIMAKFTAVLGPWGLAAGAAAIAALGLSSGSSGSYIASNEGTGTVLGDKGAKSQSLPNALSRLNDIDTMQLKYSAGMLTALRSIDNNTKVLGAALAQSGAIDISKSGEGIATGKFDTNFSNAIANVGRGAMAAVTFGVSEMLGLGKAFDSLSKNLFGKTTKITGQGIYSGEQNLGKVLSEGFDAQYYSDVLTKRKVAGFTTSKSRSTNIIDQGTEDLDRKLTMIFVNMAEALKAASGPLGLAMQDVENKINSATVSIGKVDLSGGNIEEKLQAVFSKAGDLLAEQVIPGFEEFNRLDEGYLETVIRVATGVEYATNALDMLGISAINFKDIQSKQGDVDAELIRDSILAKEGLNGISDIIKSFGGDAAGMVEAYQSLTSIRESLAGIGLTGDLVGVSLIKGGKGLDDLKSSISAFTGLLPEAEQLSLATESLRAKFKLLGIDSMPTTAEAFVSLVKGVDTTTESGKALLGKLLGLSDAFQTVADEADRIKSERVGLEEELLKLQTTEAEQRKKSLESLDPSNRALQEQIWLLQDQKKATEELTKALESAGKSIQDEINRLRGVTAGSGSGTLQAQFAIKTASARSGNLDSLKSLPDLSKAIETAVMGTASTEFEVAKTKAWLAASLSETMKMLGMSTDSSGNVTVGSSLTGTTSGSVASGGTLVVDKTNQELLTELKVLNAKVADLEAAAVATALSNSKMHKILDRVAADGNSFSVVVNTDAGPVAVESYQQI